MMIYYNVILKKAKFIFVNLSNLCQSVAKTGKGQVVRLVFFLNV